LPNVPFLRAIVAFTLSLAVAAPAPASDVQVAVEFPVDGSVVGESTCGLFVAGRAQARERALQRFDIAVVIDTSGSTVGPSGADIDGDGQRGQGYLPRNNFDPADSILAAEVAAARRLLDQVDRRLTRVAVVTFSGYPRDTVPMGQRHGRNAITRQPLTYDYERVEKALDRILADGPGGGTHMAAGIERATGELLGQDGFDSKADPKARKVVLFFTDGQPTLPYIDNPAGNVRAVLEQASRARLNTIRIYSFALGPEALDGPMASLDMAEKTGGTFVPVRNAGDVVEVVGAVDFTELSGVKLRNKTTGREADPFRATADGGWGGLVRLAPGRNRLEVVARAPDGGEARRQVTVRLVPGANPAPVPAAFSYQRNRLLEECLREMRRRREGIEAERVQAVRKELAIEIEKERKRARRRAEEQRRELEIELDEVGTP
jgi:Mg-chelatase subunit ChlD